MCRERGARGPPRATQGVEEGHHRPPILMDRQHQKVAVRTALTWAAPGDLLVLAIHQDRRAVVAFLDSLRGTGWAAGTPLPGHASAMQ